MGALSMSSYATTRSGFHPAVLMDSAEKVFAQQSDEVCVELGERPDDTLIDTISYQYSQGPLGAASAPSQGWTFFNPTTSTHYSSSNTENLDLLYSALSERLKAVVHCVYQQPEASLAFTGVLSDPFNVSYTEHQCQDELLSAFANVAVGTRNVTISSALSGAWPEPISHEWINFNSRYKTWNISSTSIDDDDGAEPTQLALDAAASFSLRAALDKLPLPNSTSLDGDGGIVFRWKNGASSASVCFAENGYLIAYAHKAGATTMFKFNERYGDDLNLSKLFGSIRSIL